MAYSKRYRYSEGKVYTYTVRTSSRIRQVRQAQRAQAPNKQHQKRTTSHIRQAPLSQQLRFANHLAHNPSTEQYLIRKGWFHQVAQLRRVRTLVGWLIYLAIVAVVLLTI